MVVCIFRTSSCSGVRIIVTLLNVLEQNNAKIVLLQFVMAVAVHQQL
jgi:hypothetical protein